MSETEAAATSAETIEALLERAKRSHVPIRNTFVQRKDGKKPIPGLLQSLLSGSDARGLDLYLLIHAVCVSDPSDVALKGHEVWARALEVPPRSASSAISKALGRLERLGLIFRVREGRKCRIFLLDEGGGGGAYQHPGKSGRYFKLSHAYWTEDWHKTLSMPAKVTLLVALSQREEFVLPIEKGRDWYGISADTLQRGFAELIEHGLLSRRKRSKKAPLAPKGITLESVYRLLPPFHKADPAGIEDATVLSLFGLA